MSKTPHEIEVFTLCKKCLYEGERVPRPYWESHGWRGYESRVERRGEDVETRCGERWGVGVCLYHPNFVVGFLMCFWVGGDRCSRMEVLSSFETPNLCVRYTYRPTRTEADPK